MPHSNPRRGPSRRAILGGMASAAAASILIGGRALAAQSQPIVETKYGKVRGFLNDDVFTFRGVPYGAPTGGDNRFRPPKEPAPWAGVHDAEAFGYSAPQTNPAAQSGSFSGAMAAIMNASNGFRASPAESEDCLVLNVWTKGLSASRKRPVMVWLHGGGYSSGSDSAYLYDGTNLVRRGDVVVVGVNHRLNAFGYTELGGIGGADFAHSGNAGQLDIVRALNWVHDNIERFGGDPKRVMIFGESGGGGKVSCLLATPPAKALFSRAVIESGPALVIAERDFASQVSEIFIKELGLTNKTLPDIRKLPTEKILAAYFACQPKLPKREPGMVGPFSPVIDPDVTPNHPFSPVASPLSKDVPLMIGWNRTEATLFSFSNQGVFSLDEAGLQKEIGGLFGDKAAALIATYRAGEPEASSPSDIYFRIATDRMMGMGSMLLADRHAALGGASTHVYRFDWASPTFPELRSPHGIEMPFVFDAADEGGVGVTGGGPVADKLAARVSQSWINFAETGDPNSRKTGLPNWPAYDSHDRFIMQFNNESKASADPFKAEREALTALMPKI